MDNWYNVLIWLELLVFFLWSKSLLMFSLVLEYRQSIAMIDWFLSVGCSGLRRVMYSFKRQSNFTYQTIIQVLFGGECVEFTLF